MRFTSKFLIGLHITISVFNISLAQDDSDRVDISQFQQQEASANEQVPNIPFDSGIKGGSSIKISDRTYSGIAIDVLTRKTFGAWKFDNGEKAGQSALNGCGTENCISYWFSFKYGAIAISPDNTVWGADSSNDLEKAKQFALGNCEKYSDVACEIVMVGYHDKAPLKYEWTSIATDGKSVGKAWYSPRKIEAETLAKEYCGSPKCWAFAFQTQFGAIASSSDKKMHGMGSDVSLKDAEEKSLKLCKTVSKKSCRILTSGSNQQK